MTRRETEFRFLNLQLDNDNFCTPKVQVDFRETRIKSLYLILHSYLFFKCYWRGNNAMLYDQIFDFFIHLILVRAYSGGVP
jgi:hypothetical protein